MQSENGSPANQVASPFWVIELIQDHYGLVTAVTAALGIVNLAIYTHFIGRPDVFLPSLELGPGLVLLWITQVLLFVFLIGSMLLSSLFLAFGLSVLRLKPKYAASIVRISVTITAIAMLGIVIPIGVADYFGVTASSWWVLSVFALPALCSWFFLQGNIEKTESLTEGLKSWKMLGACVALTLLIGFTAIVGVFTARFVTMFYEVQSAVGWEGEVLIFCFIAMFASLAPAIGFNYQLFKGRSAQVKAFAQGILVFVGVLALMVPSLLSFPSIAAVKFLGISDRQVKRYLIDSGEYPADSLDAKRWSITRSQEKKFILQAFSLYSYGSIVLLCPADILKFKERGISQHTEQCIPFAKGAVKQLDVASSTGK